jgi:hypothetical protein
MPQEHLMRRARRHSWGVVCGSVLKDRGLVRRDYLAAGSSAHPFQVALVGGDGRMPPGLERCLGPIVVPRINRGSAVPRQAQYQVSRPPARR